jgi:phosphopantothenoylcysteine synthetase/decarboxylase
VDTNVVTIFSRDGRDLPLPKLAKREVADRILDEVVRLSASVKHQSAD